jgi:MATE family multidrug resistance protein
MMAFTLMTGILIGQFHGARNYRQMGQIVWQTIFISFAYYIVLIPCALYGEAFLAPSISELGVPYLSITLLFLPFHWAGFGAIASFFLGIGRTAVVPFVILLSNGINIALDYLLIFGNGKIPPMGIRGAAYATGISQFIAFLIFFYIFLKKRYRRRYRTHVPKFSLELVKRYLPLGIPNAVNSIVNSSGFAIIFQMVIQFCSPEDVLAFSISNSIYLFFWAFVDGLGKGMSALCANYIGKNQVPILLKIARLVVKILFIFALLTLIMMVGGSSFMGRLFCIDGAGDTFFLRLRWVLFGTWIALTMDAFRWILHSILISANDVCFTVATNISCFWMLAFTPIYLSIYIFRWGGALFCWQCFALDSLCRIVLNCFRFRSELWWRKAEEVTHSSQKKTYPICHTSPSG